MSKELCPICDFTLAPKPADDDTFHSRSPHVRVSCASCNNVACRLCVQKYLLTLREEPCCMHCRTQWSLSFVTRACSVSFVNGPLRKARGRILFERERAWMPLSMEQAELKRAHAKYNELLGVLEQSRSVLSDTQRLLRNEHLLTWHFESMRHALAGLQSIGVVRATRIVRNGRQFIEYRRVSGDDAAAAAASEAAARRSFTRPCPAAECRGMLTTAWRCALCNVRVCKDCFDIKTDAEHACSEDAVASAALLRQSCKPCPNCAAPIFKVEGCDQMFCTACNTPFLWSTLAILRTGFIHNPHYFEFLDHMRRQGVENPGAMVMQRTNEPVTPCSAADRSARLQSLAIANKHALLVNARTAAIELLVALEAVARGREAFGICLYLRHTVREASHLDTHLEPHERNADLRLDFLSNACTEKAFESALSRREMQRERMTEILHIYSFVSEAMTDALLRRARGNTLPREQHEETVQELLAVLRYARCQIANVVSRFQRMAYFVSDNMTFVPVYPERQPRPKRNVAAAETVAANDLTEDEDEDEDDVDPRILAHEATNLGHDFPRILARLFR